jgi:hypothetical protein
LRRHNENYGKYYLCSHVIIMERRRQTRSARAEALALDSVSKYLYS